MQLRRTTSVCALILFATSVAFAHKVRVDYDHSVNFSKFKTYMWVEKPQTDTPLMDDRIVKAVNDQLAARGLKPVAANADLSVSVTNSIEEKQVATTYYNGYGWGWAGGWGGPGYATTYVDTYLEGTTVVELIDTAREKTVWQATGTGSVSDKPEKTSRKISKVISEMFERYPWGVTYPDTD